MTLSHDGMRYLLAGDPSLRVEQVQPVRQYVSAQRWAPLPNQQLRPAHGRVDGNTQKHRLEAQFQCSLCARTSTIRTGRLGSTF